MKRQLMLAVLAVGLCSQIVHANPWRLVARTQTGEVIDLRLIDVFLEDEHCYGARNMVFSTFMRQLQRKILHKETYVGTITASDADLATFIYAEGDNKVLFSYHCVDTEHPEAEEALQTTLLTVPGL